ncbi:hypothetical protein B0H12DRAFT_1236303 [Mycena haematopus]|nr:hypothetical protein B0H12DRAFT_1236303 [Mycena haematopus]
MSGPSGLVPLDDDIVDRIMTFCSAFHALRSIVLVSKAFYRVFQTYPKATRRHIALQFLNSNSNPALRVIRYPYHECDEPYNQYDDTPDGNWSAMAVACPEESYPIITPLDEYTLLENSRVVAALEDIYSLRNKDNKSRTSVLTSEESWRFRRAMYRIMMYCKLFPSDRYKNEQILDMDDELVGKIRKQRTAILNEYPTDEFRQLCSAVRFLVNVFVRASAFSAIVPPKAAEPASKWILDRVTSATDTCSQCAAPRGVELYTEANWDRLPALLTSFLKNHLQQDPTLSQPFRTLTARFKDSDALGPFFGDLFEFKTHTAPEFNNWRRTDSYCLPCLTNFLEEHLWIWFLEERVRGGWIPPENC